ncbi:MAG: DUF58 domain-containing protein [Parasphingopyxis sp.]|uniref:DUF58 domain-containing protein n=1 Tax=Parasphingopyxis sp. TaxID=1920299 RepID=UPI003F9F25CB
MIYPTARSVILMALGAPAALVIGVVLPQYWFLGLIWIAVMAALILLDALSAPRPGQLDAELEKPATIGVGTPFTVTGRLRFGRDAAGRPAAPRRIEIALSVDGKLDAGGGRRAAAPMIDGQAEIDTVFTANRRGTAAIGHLWTRWTGPLGLAWIQKRDYFGAEIIVTPNIAFIQDKGIQLYLRDAAHGLIAQLDRGDGTEFDSMTEFQPGMDRRTIDWKQSARHTELLAKEYRTERNNHIVFALDTGRTMCEPIAGLPRIDRAISAALLTAYVALKAGDRASLFAFAGRPQVASPTVAGARAFSALQRAAADIDYAPEESNYTLALTTLAAQLHRRSLVIVFTDFADPTSAELMLRAARRLLDRHLVLFVVLRDAELTALAHRKPEDSADVSRAVTAHALLRERAIVIARLQRMGAHVLEAGHDEVGTRLVANYVELKRRSLL